MRIPGPTFGGQRITARIPIRSRLLTIHTSRWWTKTTGEEIQFSDQRAEGYAILTGAGWRDEYVRADTPDFFRIYIRGGYVYIRDPNQEISAGDVFTVEMGGVSAPRDGDEFLLTTKEETLDAENIEADLGKNPRRAKPLFCYK